MNPGIQDVPRTFHQIDEATRLSGFTMASEPLTGSLLRTLAASKPGGKFLELGTGTGLSTSWILDGMDARASLTSVDHDSQLLEIAESFLGGDDRLTVVCRDGGEWLKENKRQQYDFVFADTWHGKYLLLEEVLAMVKAGGFYIIDDMLPQPNWPDGHAAKAKALVDHLETRGDLTLVKQDWATGIIIAVKK
jgi:predicted O-methyltransferase YrrM